MSSSEDIEVLIKVVKTLIFWSGVPSDASEDEIIVQGDMAKDDITYGDLITLSNMAQEMKDSKLKSKVPLNMRVLGDLRNLRDSLEKNSSEEDKKD